MINYIVSNWQMLRFVEPNILKEINPGISLEGMMLKLKLQYFGHLMRRVDSLEKTLMLGGIGGRRRRGRPRMRWLDGMIDSMDMSLSELREMVMDRRGLASCDSWGRKQSDMTENSHFFKQNDNLPHKKENQRKYFGIWFLGSKITADDDCSH